jgi:hypothetical protein
MHAEVVARQLRRHAARRRGGIPTLTVIVSDEPSADVAQLSSLMRPIHADLMVLSDRPVTELARAWLTALARTHDMLSSALCVVTKGKTARPELLSAWHAKSASDRERWLTQLTAGAREPAVEHAARWLRERLEPYGAPQASLEALCGVARWLSPAEWPALCVTVRAGTGLGELAELCVRVPELPLFALVPTMLWNDALSRADGRTRALLSEGKIVMPSRNAAPSRVAGEPAFTRASLTIAPAEGGELSALQTTAEQARVLAHRAQRACADDAEVLSERARSLAELLLYELLQREPATRDLFRLNGLMPFAFGSRAAEIDLVSVPLQLAIEVDGYHHFTNVSAYRRDRRKDLLLQTQGFWVLRFLADDVLDEGASIVARVCEIVTLRRQTHAG